MADRGVDEGLAAEIAEIERAFGTPVETLVYELSADPENPLNVRRARARESV